MLGVGLYTYLILDLIIKIGYKEGMLTIIYL